jgi:hypothetical protein
MKVSEIIAEQRKHIKERHVLKKNNLDKFIESKRLDEGIPILGAIFDLLIGASSTAEFGATNTPADWIYFGAQQAGRSTAEAEQIARAYLDAANSLDVRTAGELARAYITDPEKLSIAFKELGIVQHIARAPSVVSNPGALQQIKDTASETVRSLAQKIKSAVGDKISNEQIAALARGFKKYALPAAALIAVLYGGKKLYDYIKQNKEKRVAA